VNIRKLYAALLHVFARFPRFCDIQMQLNQHNCSAKPEIRAVDFIRTEGEIQPISNCQCPNLATGDVDISYI